MLPKALKAQLWQCGLIRWLYNQWLYRNNRDYLKTNLNTEQFDELSTRGLFIVGNGRSGTNVFADCLNYSDQIYMLYEANCFINSRWDDFTGAYNRMQTGLGANWKKGVYAPAAPDGVENCLEFFNRFLGHYQYVGDKITFGPNGLYGGRTAQELFFDFQAQYFYYSTYFVILRNPREVFWSSMKLFPEKKHISLLVSWLRSFQVAIDILETFPNSRMVFFDDFNAGIIPKLIQVLNVDIQVPPHLISDKSKLSNIGANNLPKALLLYSDLCARMDNVYTELRESISIDDFRPIPGKIIRAHFLWIRNLAGDILDEITANKKE